MTIIILFLKVLGLAILFVALFHHSPLAGHNEAVCAASEGPDSATDSFLEKAKEGMAGPSNRAASPTRPQS